jgi:hypothetical protein
LSRGQDKKSENREFQRGISAISTKVEMQIRRHYHLRLSIIPNNRLEIITKRWMSN